MNIGERPLRRVRVNLSISESAESTARGFPPEQVNRFAIQAAAALIGQGATVIFGHDWRDDGVMEAVHAFAQGTQSPFDVYGSQSDAEGKPLMENMVAWPDVPGLSPRDLERLTKTLRVRKVELPADVAEFGDEALNAGRGSVSYRYLRARALTNLRERLTSVTDARLCIGGRTSGFEGLLPGIIEEAFLALQNQKALYLSGLLGGATRQIIHLIEHTDVTGEFFAPTELEIIYKEPPFGLPPRWQETLRSPEEATKYFRDVGVERLAADNGLSVDENLRLFRAKTSQEVIELVLVGLGRIRRHDFHS